MGAKGKLLICGPDSAGRMLLASHLSGLGWEVLVASDVVEALGVIEEKEPLVVIEQGFEQREGSLLALLEEAGAAIPVILLARPGCEQQAKETGAAAALPVTARRTGVSAAVERAAAAARARSLNVKTLTPGGRTSSPSVVPGAAGRPKRVGRYVVRSVVGHGGHGTVYRCWDPNLDREVAVKTLGQGAVDSAWAVEMVERFKREAAASARLAHPSIVATYDFGLDEGLGQLFLAMELVEGPSLRTRIHVGPRPTLEESARIVFELADALAHAHEKDVIHRDVKPENVLLSPSGRAKLTDFGVARLGSQTLGPGNEIVGTPGYIAPEEVQGGQIDGRADQFVLGAMWHEILTGRPCFDAEHRVARVYAVLTDAPARLGDLGVAAPPVLQEVLDRMLAKAPRDRFETDDELLEALAVVAGVLGHHLVRAV